MSLTKDIKEFALDLGYSKVGITTADRFDEYIKKLESRQNMYDFYVQDPRQPLLGAERKIMPSQNPLSVWYGIMPKSHFQNHSSVRSGGFTWADVTMPPHTV